MALLDDLKRDLKSFRDAAKKKVDEYAVELVRLRELGSEDELTYEVTLARRDDEDASITVRSKGPLKEVIQKAEKRFKHHFSVISIYTVYNVFVRFSDDLSVRVGEEHWREFKVAPKRPTY